MQSHAVTVDTNKLKFKLDPSLRNIFLGMIVVGIISLGISFTVFGHAESRHIGKVLGPAEYEYHHSNMGFSSLLVATYLVLGLSVTGIFFTGIQHLSGAYWSVGVRRITETYGTFVPVVGLLLIGTIVGIHQLYEWSHPDIIATDLIIQHKSGFLNEKFFIGRVIFYVIVWSAFGWLFYKKSTEQDTTKDVETTKFMAKLSGANTIIFALSFAFAAIDLIMSLTPHWFSTMFGVYSFAAAFQTGLSSYAIVIWILKKYHPAYGEYINENHWHDIGKFLLGMTVFWAYVGFSQYMLIWYAGIPEETFFYEQRLFFGWQYLSLFLPLAKFVVPFLLLLNRPNKRDLDFLVKVAFWIIFMQIIEIYWLVFPANYTEFSFSGMVLAIGSSVGTLGLFGLWVFKKFESNLLIPVGDPRLEGCLNHHQ
jgi:hypothetical protein